LMSLSTWLPKKSLLMCLISSKEHRSHSSVLSFQTWLCSCRLQTTVTTTFKYSFNNVQRGRVHSPLKNYNWETLFDGEILLGNNESALPM
jgi:hypothetical protein